MSSDPTIPPHEIQQWITAFKSDPSMLKESRPREVFEHLANGFLKGEPEVKQEVLRRDVFKGTSNPNVTHAINGLRKLIADYCAKAGSDFVVEIKSRPYKLVFQRRSRRVSNPTDVNRHGTVGGRYIDVQCAYVGKDHAALAYVIKQLPRLRSLRDTHMRLTRDRHKYDDQPLREFENALRAFLTRDPDNKLSLIAGPMVEPNYVEKIQNAVRGNEHKLQYFKLSKESLQGPFMNFAILEYEDETREVLFGLGKFDSWPDESVFSSTDSKLVNEFVRLWATLTHWSNEVPVAKMLSETSDDSDEHATTSPWRQERMYQLLHQAASFAKRSGATDIEVRMLTTLFVDETWIYDCVMELLQNGVHVKIVMMEPEASDLLQARFERRVDYPLAKVKIDLRHQLKMFKKITATRHLAGTLEVRRSRIMPFGFFVQSVGTILLGLLPPLSAYHAGPMIEVSAESEVGKKLANNWLGYWSMRSSSELKSIEKRSSVKEVWLYSPNLSNDVGRESEFADVVRENAKRGTRYKLIFPEGKITKKALQSFRNLFPLTREKRPGLTEIGLIESEFLELIPGQQITSAEEAPHVVIYNPVGTAAAVYIEDSKSQFSFLWRKMEGDEAEIILKRFTELLKGRS